MNSFIVSIQSINCLKMDKKYHCVSRLPTFYLLTTDQCSRNHSLSKTNLKMARNVFSFLNTIYAKISSVFLQYFVPLLDWLNGNDKRVWSNTLTISNVHKFGISRFLICRKWGTITPITPSSCEQEKGGGERPSNQFKELLNSPSAV